MKLLLFTCLIAISFAQTDVEGNLCLTAEEVAALDLIPGDRSVLPTIRTLDLGWTSGNLTNRIGRILFQDVLGFETSAERVISTLQTIELFEAKEIDVAMEMWYPDADGWKRLLSNSEVAIIGDTGYPGFDGMFINNVALDPSFIPAKDGNARNNVDVFTRHYEREVVDQLAAQDPIQVARLHPGIFDKCDDTSILPSLIFAPSRCRPVPKTGVFAARNSMDWDLEGISDVPIRLDNGEIVHFDPMTQEWPECVVWNLVLENWSVNVQQAKIINLQLPAKAYFWGKCRQATIVTTMDRLGLPVIFYNFSPDALISAVPHARFTFLLYTSECVVSPATDNTWGANSSIVCDPEGFRLHSYGRPEVWENEVAADGRRMLLNFKLDQSEINNLINHVYLENKDIFDVSCEWVKNNSDIWKSWIPQEQYRIPEDPYAYLKEDKEFTVWQLTFMIIATGLLFVIIGWLTLKKLGKLQCLHDVLELLWFRSFKALLKITFDILDYTSDTFALLYINNAQGIPSWYTVLYALVMAFATIVNIRLLYIHIENLYDVCKGNDLMRLHVLSRQRFQSYQANKQLKEDTAYCGIILFEDFPILVLNLYYTFRFDDHTSWQIIMSSLIAAMGIGTKTRSTYATFHSFSSHEVVYRESTYMLKDEDLKRKFTPSAPSVEDSISIDSSVTLSTSECKKDGEIIVETAAEKSRHIVSVPAYMQKITSGDDHDIVTE